MPCNTPILLWVLSPDLFQPLTVLFEILSISMGATICLGLALEPETGVSNNQLKDTQLERDRTGDLLETRVKVVFVYRFNS